MAALSVPALEAHGHPGGFGPRLTEMVAMLAVRGDNFPRVSFEVMNGRTPPDIENHGSRLLADFHRAPGFRGEEGPPVACHGRQSSLPPGIVDRRKIAGPKLAEIGDPSLPSQPVLDEAEGRIDCEIEIRRPLRLGVVIREVARLHD